MPASGLQVHGAKDKDHLPRLTFSIRLTVDWSLRDPGFYMKHLPQYERKWHREDILRTQNKSTQKFERKW